MGKKVFIAGGGTGGHFYPALRMAEAFYEKGFEITYLGAEKGIEGRKDFPYGKKVLFDIRGVRGKGIKAKVFSSLELLKTAFKIKKLIEKEDIDFSLCFGGYASLPLGLASVFSKVPLYIHEQNSIPSYTNKLLSVFAKKIFITFSYSKRFFPEKKTVFTGFPIRSSLKKSLSLPVSEAKSLIGVPIDKKNILVFGGSQGAKKLTELAEYIAKENPDFHITVITGKNSSLTASLPNITSFDYFEDMGILYKSSDIVISRAGAGTVSEILLYGKFTIFIPYPYAASNHQYYNVKWLKDMGLAEVITEKDLSFKQINKLIKDFLSRENKKLIEAQIKSLSVKNAEEKILEEILNDIEGRPETP
ncbi:MAG: undecaprenyldiphospho-muramoylpentapeptide beta-N-acetylglucosaminyltransferase [Aquificota bacterium]|nr:MAG: undecaprenyldiphospho-muramoylpentapeptide beta-N-acetylglucosaminyltransferase [Aquificota bacterium]